MTSSFAVYRSSAGSGKTFTLVREYLKIILREPGDFRNILAITFTNKAANEMKDRILQALGELSSAGHDGGNRAPSPMLTLLTEDLSMPVEAIRASAGRALELILHNYSDLSVGTIDSFSHRLIRSFAFDFNLPVNFEVELDSDELLATAIDLLLEKVGEDEQVTRLLVDFLESRMDEDRGWNIEKLLTGFAGILLDEEGQSRVRKIRKYSLDDFRQIARAITLGIRDFERRMKEIAGEAAGLISVGNIPLSAFYYGERGIGAYFLSLATGRPEKIDPNSNVQKTVNEDKWTSAKASPADQASIIEIKPQLLALYDRLMELFASQKADYRLRKLLLKTIYPLAVLNEIERVLSDFKKQNNIVHISEFNATIASVVRNEPVPFIFERIGEKYRHIFIDEFQDTSAMQWMNYIPLIENALSSGWFNLVVGDGKQAIYRWRNGDVEQFNALPSIAGSETNEVLRQREGVLTRHYQSAGIRRNYRSKAEIVEFNNLFFRTIADLTLFGSKAGIYDGLEQEFDPANTGGVVSIEFVAKSTPDEDSADETLARVLDIIENASSDRFRLMDMAVLCRSNRQASEVARFLLANNVNVISAESLLLGNSLKIRFVIACLNHLFMPGNDIVAEEIRQFTSDPDGGRVLAGGMADELLSLPVYDLVETLIRKFALDSQPDAYLQFFLDAVLKYTVKVSSSPSGFLDWWEKNKGKTSIIVPGGLDAVRVMTIHKAKGLQFPLVILPYARESLKNTRDYLWVDLDPAVANGLGSAILRSERAMEETVFQDLYQDEQQKSMLDMLNLLYVAMTRPEERLYILSGRSESGRDNHSSWAWFFEHFLRTQGKWEEGVSKYSVGTPTRHVLKEDKSKVEVINLNSLINNDWRKKILIRRRDDSSGIPGIAGEQVAFGKLLHLILSWTRTADDIRGALDRALLWELVREEELPALAGTLEGIVTHPDLSDLFKPGLDIKIETEILLPDGSFFRPDRVVVTGDGVTVVDYKTGQQKEEYSTQVAHYLGLLREMDYRNVSGLLVFISPGISVVKVD